MLGAVVGAIATAAGSSLLYWKRQRDAIRRLRRAFAEELRAYEYVDDLIAGVGYEWVTERVEEPAIYESAAGNLGLLTAMEIGRLVTFFSAIYWLEGLEDKQERIDRVAEKRREVLEAVE